MVASFLGVRTDGHTDRHGFGILTWKHVVTQKISTQSSKLVVSRRSLYASPEDGMHNNTLWTPCLYNNRQCSKMHDKQDITINTNSTVRWNVVASFGMAFSQCHQMALLQFAVLSFMTFIHCFLTFLFWYFFLTFIYIYIYFFFLYPFATSYSFVARCYCKKKLQFLQIITRNFS